MRENLHTLWQRRHILSIISGGTHFRAYNTSTHSKLANLYHKSSKTGEGIEAEGLRKLG
jgi:hypothetical protein